jgi:hypothetical protein
MGQAEKNNSKVKYATGGLSREIFVVKYLLELPSEEELKKLIEADREAFEDRRIQP